MTVHVGKKAKLPEKRPRPAPMNSTEILDGLREIIMRPTRKVVRSEPKIDEPKQGWPSDEDLGRIAQMTAAQIRKIFKSLNPEETIHWLASFALLTRRALKGKYGQGIDRGYQGLRNFLEIQLTANPVLTASSLLELARNEVDRVTTNADVKEKQL